MVGPKNVLRLLLPAIVPAKTIAREREKEKVEVPRYPCK